MTVSVNDSTLNKKNEGEPRKNTDNVREDSNVINYNIQQFLMIIVNLTSSINNHPILFKTRFLSTLITFLTKEDNVNMSAYHNAFNAILNMSNNLEFYKKIKLEKLIDVLKFSLNHRKDLFKSYAPIVYLQMLKTNSEIDVITYLDEIISQISTIDFDYKYLNLIDKISALLHCCFTKRTLKYKIAKNEKFVQKILTYLMEADYTDIFGFPTLFYLLKILIHLVDSYECFNYLCKSGWPKLISLK